MTSRRLRILYLTTREVWPPVSGAKLRDYHLTRALGKHADLTYVFYSHAGTTPVNTTGLPFCASVVSVPAPKRYTPLKVVLGVVGRWPLTVLNYTSSEMVATVRRLLREQRIDLVHVDCTNLAGCTHELIRELDQVPVFYDWHNIESEVMVQYGEQAGFLRKMYALTTATRLRHLEGDLLRSAAGHIVCSEREQLVLRQREPSARVAIIENGVEVAAFSGLAGCGAPRHRIVFVGSMDYHANIDASLYFGREIWPRLRSRLQGWKLTLVGSRPSPEVIALANDPSIEVTGTVPDVRPYYGEAVAAVVPLRLGGGTRLKILEAMAAGVPVISTMVGAEGLEVRPGRDILIAQTEQDWESALTTIQTSNSWNGLSIQGRELVSRRYDWDIIGARLFELYAGWLGG